MTPQLTIHADRGSSMKSKPVAFLLADLGVTKPEERWPQLAQATLGRVERAFALPQVVARLG